MCCSSACQRITNLDGPRFVVAVRSLQPVAIWSRLQRDPRAGRALSVALASQVDERPHVFRQWRLASAPRRFPFPASAAALGGLARDGLSATPERRQSGVL